MLPLRNRNINVPQPVASESFKTKKEVVFRKPFTRADAKENAAVLVEAKKSSAVGITRASSFANGKKSTTTNKQTVDLDRLVRPTITSLRRQHVADTARSSIAPTREEKKEKEDFAKTLTLPMGKMEEESVLSSDSTPSPDEASYSTAMIPDIDADDAKNPLQGPGYVIDIYQYLGWLERKQGIKEDYLAGQAVTCKMRAILTDWLVQVHSRFHLLPETLHMTILLLDRFLQVTAMNKEQLQLVGVTCMFIASKYEEMYAPEISDFVYITDNTYTKHQILEMEMRILNKLRVELGRPYSIHFLRRYSKAFDADADTHNLAKYLSESALVDYSLVHVLPSQIAAASLWIALHLRSSGKWDAKMVHYSQYSEEDLKPTVRRLARSVFKAHTNGTKLTAICKKYCSLKFMSVAKLSAEQLQKLDDFAEA